MNESLPDRALSFAQHAVLQRIRCGLDGNSAALRFCLGQITQGKNLARLRMFIRLSGVLKLAHWWFRKGVHNFSHPRTDPVVIMAVLDEKADKILLGRNVSAHCNYVM